MAINPNQFAIDVPDPSKVYADSFINAQKIGMLQAQSQLAQQELQRKQQLQTDLSTLGSNPTPQQIAAISGKYPELSEHFKRSYDMLTSEQQQSRLSNAIPIYAAVASGNYQTAIDQLNKNAEAYTNSGKPDEAKASTMLAQLVQLHPETANKTMGLMLASQMGADKFATTFGELSNQTRNDQKQPTEMRLLGAQADKAQADASKAQTDANYAPVVAETDLTTKRLNNKLSVLDAQIKKANSENDRMRLQNERDKTQIELNKYKDEKSGKQQDAQNNIDDLNNALGLMKGISEDDLRSASGLSSMVGFVPGTRTRSIQGKISQIQNILASTDLNKLKGAMSDKDILFIKNIQSNFDTAQNEDEFIKEFQRVQGNLEKALQKRVVDQNAPTQGGAFVVKTPTLGVIREGDITRLMQKNPGATRDQVMQYLQSVGGQR